MYPPKDANTEENTTAPTNLNIMLGTKTNADPKTIRQRNSRQRTEAVIGYFQ